MKKSDIYEWVLFGILAVGLLILVGLTIYANVVYGGKTIGEIPAFWLRLIIGG